MERKSYFFKVIISLFLSLASSYLLLTMIFTQSSPIIRKNLPASFIKKLAYLKNFFQVIFPRQEKTRLSYSLSKTNLENFQGFQKVNYPQPVKTSKNSVKERVRSTETSEKGVYQKEDDQASYLLLKEEEINWVKQIITINQEKIEVFLPEGERE